MAKIIELFTADFKTSLKLPLFSNGVPAGFPSFVSDHLEKKMDLNELLIKHPTSTFFARVQGDSMKEAGILDGDIVIVDRALSPKHGDIVIAALEGELTLKYLFIQNGIRKLMPANSDYQPIELHEDQDAIIWGVIKHAIHSF